ncbi:hypothetical protein F4814DRAFT_460425 [Daldinia grandis]|nr:hypothetical protein F4814DRAFT_460425 [Daldinia grandis]
MDFPLDDDEPGDGLHLPPIDLQSRASARPDPGVFCDQCVAIIHRMLSHSFDLQTLITNFAEDWPDVDHLRLRETTHMNGEICQLAQEIKENLKRFSLLIRGEGEGEGEGEGISRSGSTETLFSLPLPHSPVPPLLLHPEIRGLGPVTPQFPCRIPLPSYALIPTRPAEPHRPRLFNESVTLAFLRHVWTNGYNRSEGAISCVQDLYRGYGYGYDQPSVAGNRFGELQQYDRQYQWSEQQQRQYEQQQYERWLYERWLYERWLYEQQQQEEEESDHPDHPQQAEQHEQPRSRVPYRGRPWHL